MMSVCILHATSALGEQSGSFLCGSENTLQAWAGDTALPAASGHPGLVHCGLGSRGSSDEWQWENLPKV